MKKKIHSIEEMVVDLPPAEALIRAFRNIPHATARKQAEQLLQKRWCDYPHRILRITPSGSYREVPYLLPVIQQAAIYAQMNRVDPRGYRVMQDDLQKIQRLSSELSKALHQFPKDTGLWVELRAIMLDDAEYDSLLDALPLVSWKPLIEEAKNNLPLDQEAKKRLSVRSEPTLPDRLASLSNAFEILGKQICDEKIERIGAPIVNDHARPMDLGIFDGLARVMRSLGFGLEHLREIASVIYAWATEGELMSPSKAAREEVEARKKNPAIQTPR